MNDKPIRIIKRGEKDGHAKRVVETSVRAEEKPDASSDAKTTVTAWVQEFQRRRKGDAGRGFRKLFEDAAPQTGKA